MKSSLEIGRRLREIASEPLPAQQPHVAILDDDRLVSQALAAALATLDVEVAVFTSADDFAADQAKHRTSIGCSLIDLRLNDESGLEVIRLLASDDTAAHRPTILVSGYADVGCTVEAMVLGCWTVLQKPISVRIANQTVAEACAWSRMNRARIIEESMACESWETVTDQEKAIIALLLEGLPNKAVATRLGVCTRTIEGRRRQIFDKLRIDGIAQLGRVVATVEGRESRHNLSMARRVSEYRVDEKALVPPANNRIARVAGGQISALRAYET